MRTRIVTAFSGIILSVAIASCETYGAATGSTIPQPVRVWMVGVFIAAVVIVATQTALEQLITAIRQQQFQRQVQDQAADDYLRLRKLVRDDDGVTRLYPEE